MPEWNRPDDAGSGACAARRPSGSRVPSGAISDHRIADARVELVRQRAAEDDAVAAGRQLLEAAGDHVLRQAGGARAPRAGSTPRTCAPAMRCAVGEHRLALDVGHRRQHAGLAAHLLLQLLPVT